MDSVWWVMIIGWAAAALLAAGAWLVLRLGGDQFPSVRSMLKFRGKR